MAVASDAGNVRRAIDELPAQPTEWSQASTLSDALLRLTPQEAEALLGEVTALVERYRDIDAADAPADARRYTLIWHGFLTPGLGEDRP